MRTTQPQVLLARLLERLALPLERLAEMLTAAELAQPMAKQMELLPKALVLAEQTAWRLAQAFRPGQQRPAVRQAAQSQS
jgi:hypothetical protein